ncbi:twin-arginine translocase subunit TatC, partial [uncultured Selenomonas sp.]|uniref:twin-arginine translocase subunit TatC n=1 Tax=uncultured Selenomonas sp. TaxID=159275 RepID=UPI00258C9430
MTEEREVPEETAAASAQGTATERPAAAPMPEEAPAAEAKAAIEPAAAPPEEPEDDGSMSLIAHLTELRARLIKCLIAVALGSCVGYYFLDEIMHYLTLPAGKLYYMQPSEAFFT